MANMLDALFKPFFGWDIVATYSKAHSFIDFVLYLLIFLYITRYAISKRFEGATAKSLSMVLAIVLALGMSVGSAKWGFQLGDLGPLAGLIFFGMLALVAYNLLKNFGAGTPSAGAFALILAYFTIKMTAPKFIENFEKLGGGVVGTLVAFAIFLSVLTVIAGLGKGVHSAVSGTGGIGHAKRIGGWLGSKGMQGAKGLGKMSAQGAKGLGGMMGKGYGLVNDKIKKQIEKKQKNIAKEEEEKKEMDEKFSKLEADVKELADVDSKWIEEEEFKNKQDREQIEYINRELESMGRLHEALNKLDDEFEAVKAQNRFTDNVQRIVDIDKRIEDYFQRYVAYKDDMRKRIEWLERQVVNKDIKKMMKGPEKIIKDLRKEIDLLGEEHAALLAAYNNVKSLAQGSLIKEIDKEAREEYVRQMGEYAERIKEVIRLKKEEEAIYKEEMIAYEARQELQKAKRVEKRLLKSLFEITHTIDKNVGKIGYLRRKKNKSPKEIKEFKERKVEVREQREIFKQKLKALYNVNIKESNLNNNIKQLNTIFKRLKQEENVDAEKVVGESKQVFG